MNDKAGNGINGRGGTSSDALVRDLTELRQAVAAMDAKLDQLRHDHDHLASQFQKTVDARMMDMGHTRRDLEQVSGIVDQLHQQLSSMSTEIKALVGKPGQVIRLADMQTKPTAVTAKTPASDSPASRTDDAGAAGSRPESQGEGIVEEINYDDFKNMHPRGLPNRPGQPSLFDVDRVFFQSHTQGTEQGWFFSLSDGKLQGPFSTKETAEHVREEMIERTRPGGKPRNQN